MKHYAVSFLVALATPLHADPIPEEVCVLLADTMRAMAVARDAGATKAQAKAGISSVATSPALNAAGHKMVDVVYASKETPAEIRERTYLVCKAAK